MTPRGPGLRLPRSWLALLAATGLASGVAGGVAVAWLAAGRETAVMTAGAPVSTDAVPLNRLTVAPLVARVAPAVVNVAVLQASPYAQNPLLRDPYYRFFLGVPDDALAPRISAGSGFVVDAARGLVVTNHHVVETPAQSPSASATVKSKPSSSVATRTRISRSSASPHAA